MISFQSIEIKVHAQERLTQEEGEFLFSYPDLFAVARLAHTVRSRLHGGTTYYNWNLHLNSTNVCEANCLFCSFARLKTGMPQAYTMQVTDAERWIRERYKVGMTEIHIVNGLNPDLDFDYYPALLRMIRREFPALHIKAFTAVEVHRVAHALGLKSNCTMLYGTIETTAERVDHMLRLRALQDESAGFQVFIPLAFHNEGNRMERLSAPTAVDDLRVIAISRLMLDNIPHIKAYWVMLGVKSAQIALLGGANDIDGTVTEEKIYHMAGSQSPDALPLGEIRRLIEAAGLTPQERTTTYEIVNRAA